MPDAHREFDVFPEREAQRSDGPPAEPGAAPPDVGSDPRQPSGCCASFDLREVAEAVYGRGRKLFRSLAGPSMHDKQGGRWRLCAKDCARPRRPATARAPRWRGRPPVAPGGKVILTRSCIFTV